MNTKKSIICFLSFVIGAFITSASHSEDINSIEINIREGAINYGTPIVLTLRTMFQQPQKSPITGKPVLGLHLDGLSLQVENTDTGELCLFPFRMPVTFRLQGSEGLEYVSRIVVFCDLYKEKKKFIKRIIFDKPGVYALDIMRDRNQISNTLDILVESSNLGEKALSLLEDPNDIAFLLGGIVENSEKKERSDNLKKITEECEGTVLAQWSSARLGIEYFKDFHEKHPSFTKFKEQKEKQNLTEPFFDDAYKYLEKGYQLPDEFPIREEIIDKLVRFEYVRGNYDRAISLVDEVETKYPHSEFGKKASRVKEELIGIKEKEEKEKASEPNIPEE